jgi:TetR/AcrR family transcriptional regulator, repressor for uid operon
MRKIDPEKQLAKRRQILDAAMICFAKQGFHATSTAQICTQAGMSPGNLFHYFPTKDSIICAIAELDRAETLATLSVLDAADDIVIGLQNVARQVILASSEPTYGALSIEIAAEAARNPIVAAMFEESDKIARSQISKLLARGIERGQIDATLDLNGAAAWLMALLEGGIGRAAMGANFDMATHLTTLQQMILRFLRPPV